MVMEMNQSLMLPRVLKRLTEEPPADYRSGVTLERAVRELRAVFRVDDGDPSRLTLRTAAGEREILAHERVERHFLMHIVGIELAMQVAAVSLPGAAVEIRNTGILRRTGIRCVSSTAGVGLNQFMATIEADHALREVLMKLDFRRIRLRGVPGGWEIRIEPYGACEVVNRMPSFRRYIKMGVEQAEAVAQTFYSLNRIVVLTYGE